MVTTTFASPLGEILLAADGRGLTGLWFEGQEHFGSTLLKEDAEYVEGADAVSDAIKPQEITVKICQCFEGSNKVVHFSGKVLDLKIRSLGPTPSNRWPAKIYRSPRDC